MTGSISERPKTFSESQYSQARFASFVCGVAAVGLLWFGLSGGLNDMPLARTSFGKIGYMILLFGGMTWLAQKATMDETFMDMFSSKKSFFEVLIVIAIFAGPIIFLKIFSE